MQKYLTERGEVTFDKIFDQRLGEYSMILAQTWAC